MKICLRCKIEKEEDDFHRSSHFKDGRQRYCKPCKKTIDAKIYAKGGEEYKRRKRIRQRNIAHRNARLVFDYLQEHPCVDCGEADPLVLEFDHVRGEKKFNLGDIVRNYYKWETIRAEIDKCQVRCANCHRRATAIRSGNKRYQFLLEIEEAGLPAL